MTTTTRRNLLRAAVAGGALGPFVVDSEALAASTTRSHLYSRRRFSALRRRSFRLESAHGHYRVRLTRIDNLPNCARKADHAFSLTFRAGRTGPTQGSYLLRRPGFTPTTLFLVPSDRGRRTYEAVIFRKP